jgi:hypothetical protein
MQGFRPARGLGDDVDALLLEQVAQAGAEEVVVVDEQDADGVALGFPDRYGLVQRCSSDVARAQFTGAT